MRLKLEWYRVLYGSAWKEEAMTRIWNTSARKLRLYIVQTFRLREEAEDIVQEVMLRMYNSLESYDARYSLNTWLYTLCRNRCIDLLRTRKQETEFREEAHYRETLTPEKEFIRDEIEERIRALLAVMAEEYRETAFLRFFEKMDYKTIAEITGVSLQIVKNRVFTVRKKLKAGLKEYR